jgi:hypothetical protein
MTSDLARRRALLTAARGFALLDTRTKPVCECVKGILHILAGASVAGPIEWRG